MLELIAKDNTEVSVSDGLFPIGQKDTVKIYIEDKIIKDKVTSLDTGVCNPQYNYYSYGYFLNVTDINNISQNLNNNCKIDITNTVIHNENSNSLHLVSNNNNGLGIVRLKTDKNIVNSTSNQFIFSCGLFVKSGIVNLVFTDNNNTVVLDKNYDVTDDWVDLKETFVATANLQFITLQINIQNTGEAYIDAISVYNSENETKNINYDLCVNLVIDNPHCMNSKNINHVINWNKDSINDKLWVLLDFPEITYVDACNNILCRLVITQKLKEKVSTLGNILYNKTDNVIYNSQQFLLTGYDIPLQLSFTFNQLTYNEDEDIFIATDDKGIEQKFTPNYDKKRKIISLTYGENLIIKVEYDEEENLLKIGDSLIDIKNYK